jgi:hypothetical protein
MKLVGLGSGCDFIYRQVSTLAEIVEAAQAPQGLVCVGEVPAPTARAGHGVFVQEVSELGRGSEAQLGSRYEMRAKPKGLPLRFSPVPLRQKAAGGSNYHPAPFSRSEGLSCAKRNASGFLLGECGLDVQHELVLQRGIDANERDARLKQTRNEVHVPG